MTIFPVADIRVHIDTLEYTREGLKTKEPISLQVGSHNRVVLIRPERQPAFAATYGCFSSESSFPGPAFLSLLIHEHQLGNARHTLEDAVVSGKIQLFGHADSSGSEADNKALTDRRAQAVRAFLTADLATLLELSKFESWQTPIDQVMLRCLGCDPGPIDGKHEDLTTAAATRFQERYVTAAYHQADDALLHPSLEPDGKLDPLTFEALLDAYLHHFSPRIDAARLLTHAASGCAAFNSAVEDAGSNENRRVSLVVHPNDPPHPEATPCAEGNADACPVVPSNSRASCMWYREHVSEGALERAVHYNFLPSWLPLSNGKYMLSVLTTVPDGEELVFEVFASEDRVGTPERRPSRIIDAWPIAKIPSVIEGGVAQVVWDPPPDFEPGPDGRTGGVVPGFAASHAERSAIVHSSYPTTSILVLFLQSEDARDKDLEGTLELTDSQGNTTSTMCSNAVPYDATHLVVRFEGVNPDEKYTLVHTRPGAPPLTLAESVHYTLLETHGELAEPMDEEDDLPERPPLGPDFDAIDES